MTRQMKVDDITTDIITGTAPIGTADNSPNWKIFKKDVTGNDYDILFPTDETGMPSDKEKFKWSDRLLLNFQSTKDVTAPTLVSAARVDDTHIEVTLSELADQDSITKANAGGFTVEDLSVPETTYAVSAIAPGATNNKIILTVASIAASIATGVKIKYATGVNGTVKDVASIALATNAVGVDIATWA